MFLVIRGVRIYLVFIHIIVMGKSQLGERVVRNG